MKIKHTGTTTFVPAIKRLVINGVALSKKDIYLIINATRNVVMYNFADTSLNATSVISQANPPSTEVILSFDTTSFNSADDITVIYDDNETEVNVGNFPDVQKSVITNGLGTIPATVKDSASGAPQNMDTALVVGLHPAGAKVTVEQTDFTKLNGVVRAQDSSGNDLISTDTTPASNQKGLVVRNIPSGIQNVSCRDGNGNIIGTAVSEPGASDRGLIVRNIPTGVQNVSVQNSSLNAVVSAGSESLNCRTMIVSSQGSANPVLVPTVNEAIATTSRCLLVKNVNMVRLSGDTFVEERRPDICVASEWNNLASGANATIYTRQNPARRMRVNQIIVSWVYVGNATGMDIYGQFVFQYWTEAGAWSGDILKTRLKSGQMHIIPFPNGIIAPAAGGTVRVVNETSGGNINMNFNITLWEE